VDVPEGFRPAFHRNVPSTFIKCQPRRGRRRGQPVVTYRDVPLDQHTTALCRPSLWMPAREYCTRRGVFVYQHLPVLQLEKQTHCNMDVLPLMSHPE
jgi:hypothetical protein